MKTNILFIVPSLCRGGAETQLVDLINGLPDHKYEKHLLTFDQGLDLKDRLRGDVVHIHHMKRRARLDFMLILAIQKLIDQIKITIVHTTLDYAMFNGWLAARLSKQRPAVVHAIHSTSSRDAYVALQERLVYRYIMRRCDRLIFVCDKQKQYWLGRFPELASKAAVIHNGINTDWFDPDLYQAARADFRRQYFLPEGAIVFICIAGFRPEKGHKFLLNAFSSLIERIPNVFLLLAGDGVERAAIEDHICKHELTERVRLLGNVSDVRPTLAASDISILASSTTEAFSIAMLESLSMRVPMIATDIGGASEAIFPGQTGMLVPAGNVMELAAAMVRLANDASLRRSMAINGRNLVIKRFQRQRMISLADQLLVDVGKK
jgi:glycosyltransferase involved in cell wall biosynthesis